MIVLTALIGASLGACSTLRLAYNNADRIVFRYMDEYLDLTTAQKEFIRPELRTRLDEHRREELPRLIELLDRVYEYGRDGLSAQETVAILDAIVDLYGATTRKTVSVLAPVLGQLSVEQLAHLEAKLREANQMYYGKYLVFTADQRKFNRAKQIIRRIERWTGKLSAKQARLVTRLSDSFPDTYQDWYVYRQRQQRVILTKIRNRAPVSELERYLNLWWVEQTEMSPQLDSRIRQMWTIINEMVVSIDRSLTEEQRQSVLGRLTELTRQLRNIAG